MKHTRKAQEDMRVESRLSWVGASLFMLLCLAVLYCGMQVAVGADPAMRRDGAETEKDPLGLRFLLSRTPLISGIFLVDIAEDIDMVWTGPSKPPAHWDLVEIRTLLLVFNGDSMFVSEHWGSSSSFPSRSSIAEAWEGVPYYRKSHAWYDILRSSVTECVEEQEVRVDSPCSIRYSIAATARMDSLRRRFETSMFSGDLLEGEYSFGNPWRFFIDFGYTVEAKGNTVKIHSQGSGSKGLAELTLHEDGTYLPTRITLHSIEDGTLQHEYEFEGWFATESHWLPTSYREYIHGHPNLEPRRPYQRLLVVREAASVNRAIHQAWLMPRLPWGATIYDANDELRQQFLDTGSLKARYGTFFGSVP